MALYDSGRTTFATAEAAHMIGRTFPLTSSLLHKARKRGLVSQLKRGLFVIVPPELGSSAAYAGNPYLVARYLVDDALFPFSRGCDGAPSHGDAVCHLRFERQTHSQSNAARNPVPFCSAEVRGFFLHYKTLGQRNKSRSKQATLNVPSSTASATPNIAAESPTSAKGLWMRHDDLSLVRNASSKLITGAKTRELENKENTAAA
jgi:hypothetical protein